MPTTPTVPHPVKDALDNVQTRLQAALAPYVAKAVADLKSLGAEAQADAVKLEQMAATDVADLEKSLLAVLDQGVLPKLEQALPQIIALVQRSGLQLSDIPKVLTNLLTKIVQTMTVKVELPAEPKPAEPKPVDPKAANSAS